MCSTSTRHMTRRSNLHGTTTDPALRVGDEERQHAAASLGQAFTQGYLSMEEYESRLGQAFSAQTAGALNRLTADLPVDQIGRRDPRHQAARHAVALRGLQIHVIGYLATSLLMIAIWLTVALANGAWYFWPIWPILGAGIGVTSHAIPVAGARTRARRVPSHVRSSRC